MSEVTYPVDAATLPQGSCPATYQELAALLASVYSVSISTNNTGIYVSQTSPADKTLFLMFKVKSPLVLASLPSTYKE